MPCRGQLSGADVDHIYHEQHDVDVARRSRDLDHLHLDAARGYRPLDIDVDVARTYRDLDLFDVPRTFRDLDLDVSHTIGDFFDGSPVHSGADLPTGLGLLRRSL